MSTLIPTNLTFMMFTFDSDTLRSLRRKTTKHDTRVKLIENTISHYGKVGQAPIWKLVLFDPKLDVRIRGKAAYELGQLGTLDAIRALRLILHDETQPERLRISVLYDMRFIDEETYHIDLRAILADPSVPVAIRAEAAEKADAPRCLPIIKALLAQDDLHEELAFWCVYACASLGLDDPEVDHLLKRRTHDHREVDPKMGSVQKQLATVAMEATWAINQRAGRYSEPQWTSEDVL